MKIFSVRIFRLQVSSRQHKFCSDEMGFQQIERSLVRSGLETKKRNHQLFVAQFWHARYSAANDECLRDTTRLFKFKRIPVEGITVEFLNVNTNDLQTVLGYAQMVVQSITIKGFFFV
ncbi:hypothetical protein CDAR_312171 [Caerostris darwini]|uniref:Uncharacterized protein n=1 Tax=Caerostris darwini TaxID=1538125 RepID=A0AAV4S6J6_9ARAC|nr:hypothetical protein CDAR_312171 [Caerostris darwini]